MSIHELEAAADKLMKEMQKAAAELEFEKAAELRDKMMEIRRKLAEK